MAKWEDINKDWPSQKDKAKERWDKLSDEDIEQTKGDREQVVKSLMARYDFSRQEAESEADSFAASLYLSGH